MAMLPYLCVKRPPRQTRTDSVFLHRLSVKRDHEAFIICMGWSQCVVSAVHGWLLYNRLVLQVLSSKMLNSHINNRINDSAGSAWSLSAHCFDFMSLFWFTATALLSSFFTGSK